MDCQFVVGQKVVYVEHQVNPLWIPRGEKFPIIGKIYTIRQVGLEPWCSEPVIWLMEIVNPVLGYTWCGTQHTWETPFMARLFRAVEEKKTDISIFTKMLTTEFVETVEKEKNTIHELLRAWEWE